MSLMQSTYRGRRIANIGGFIMSRDNAPLDNDDLRAAVPSIFAETAHESRSERFVTIPTINVLEGLRKEGFEAFSAAQSRTRDESKRDFTKHMVRMRHRGITNESGQAFEIVLVNANDGTSAYHMVPGFFRFVCANGMIAGETFETVKVRHSGNAVDDVIEGAYRVLDDAPRITDQVAQWRGITLSDPERMILAESAHVLRFGDDATADSVPAAPEQLIRPRRHADNSRDLWATFNVVQENVIRGGIHGRVTDSNGRRRNATTREIKGIGQVQNLNRALWTLAERMAELKAA